MVQAVLAAFAVPTHTPLALQVSGWVHSLPSLHDVLGVQVPMHDPLMQAWFVHALQMPFVPPPQVFAF